MEINLRQARQQLAVIQQRIKTGTELSNVIESPTEVASN